MAVLIKGMEMPVTCCHCPLMMFYPEVEWNDNGRKTVGAYVCCQTGELIDNTKREDHCPLIEVSEPHGRLIDADALMKDGWVLRKDIPRMCGIATHEMPLNCPSLSVIIPASEVSE